MTVSCPSWRGRLSALLLWRTRRTNASSGGTPSRRSSWWLRLCFAHAKSPSASQPAGKFSIFGMAICIGKGQEERYMAFKTISGTLHCTNPTQSMFRMCNCPRCSPRSSILPKSPSGFVLLCVKEQQRKYMQFFYLKSKLQYGVVVGGRSGSLPQMIYYHFPIH